MKQLKILLWFLARPRYYRYFVYFVSWKLRSSRNTPEESARARQWCEQNAVDRDAVLRQVTGGMESIAFDQQFKATLDAAEKSAAQATISMGGAGDMSFIYQIAEHLQATSVIETGVAYGWSSLALLLSLAQRPSARLVSTNLAYPRGNSEQYVGIVVPEDLKSRWTIIPYPDRQALPRALKLLPRIDLCHYDSDKTYEGRQWTYPRLWDALRSGGVFISDDIGDNFGFRDFCQQIQHTPLIYAYKNKYIGIVVKNESSV